MRGQIAKMEYLSIKDYDDSGQYLEGVRGAAAPQGQKSQTIFLGKAKYFITILTKSHCGVAKLLFITM
jgi:hypothetical protein